MPDPVEQNLLPVIQADREAAAALVRKFHIVVELNGLATYDVKGILEGRYDDSEIVQAFARHRIEHAPPVFVEGEIEWLNEAIIEALIAASPRRMKRIGDMYEPGKSCVEWGLHGAFVTIRTMPLARAALAALPLTIDRAGIVEECRKAVERCALSPDTAGLSEGQLANLDGWNHAVETAADALSALSLSPSGVREKK